jgi:hypothetical protein
VIRDAATRPRLIALGIVLLIGLALYIVENRATTENQKTLDELKMIQYAQCLSGNATRLNNFGDAKADEQESLAFESQEHDPEIARIWHRRAQRKLELQDSILAAAAQRGELPDPHQPIVECPPP